MHNREREGQKDRDEVMEMNRETRAKRKNMRGHLRLSERSG